MKRSLRLLLAVAAGSVGVLTVPATAAAAARQCLSDGTVIAPVPAVQQMMAPDRVWPLSTGAGQRVAVIGTGIAANPLLDGHIVDRTSLVPGASPEEDCLGVGTAVAGIVAARRSDTVGFHGMAPGARLLSVRVVGDEPTESVAPDTIAAAIDWAVDRQAGVVAVTAIAYQESETLRQAVRRALSGNVVLVAATGDISQNTVGSTPYPAAYEGVLGVGSIGQNGTVSPFSRQQNVSLVAPGADVVTTYPGSGLGAAAGTAFATGYVAGAAALVRAYRPGLSGSDVVGRLLATATPAPEGTGSAAYGNGIVNPYQAVADEITAAQPKSVPGPVATTLSAAEQARLADQERGDRLAHLLAGIGVVVAVLLAAILGFGARGRHRRWRTGLAPAPQDRAESERPEPPVELFADRNG